MLAVEDQLKEVNFNLFKDKDICFLCTSVHQYDGKKKNLCSFKDIEDTLAKEGSYVDSKISWK